MKHAGLPSPAQPDETTATESSAHRLGRRGHAPALVAVSDAAGGEPLGAYSRRMEAAAGIREQSAVVLWFRRIGDHLVNVARLLIHAPGLFARVAREHGVPIRTQIAIQARLTFRQGLDPSMYYLFELYQPGGLAKVDQYLLRREIKGDLFRRLHRLQPKVGDRRINLGDKMQLFAACARAGLPHAAPVMLIEDGQPVWQTADPLDLDRDLFVKPRIGRGAAGVSLYRRMAAFQYVDGEGHKRTLGQIVSAVLRQFGKRPMMILPRLRNHPAIADMAADSLITFRLVTCINDDLQPELVVAYIRVLSKLEPSWPKGKPPLEYAAVVDLETGRLGLMTGDTPECLSQWYERHPVTGVDVVGRQVPFWNEMATLAERAHQVCRDRVLVGWDIAMTPEGPVLLEGNTYPDMHFPQRVYRRPYGEMRVGTLLRFNLARLEAQWAAEKKNAGK
jgi:hypothetical protein